MCNNVPPTNKCHNSEAINILKHSNAIQSAQKFTMNGYMSMQQTRRMLICHTETENRPFQAQAADQFQETQWHLLPQHQSSANKTHRCNVSISTTAQRLYFTVSRVTAGQVSTEKLLSQTKETLQQNN